MNTIYKTCVTVITLDSCKLLLPYTATVVPPLAAFINKGCNTLLTRNLGY